MKRLLILASLIGAAPALADEGMWTYNNFPAAKVKEKYGFEPSQAWLDKVRLSSAKFGGGCSASFVSPNGLVMTNHHCARGCIQQLSTAQKDLIANGFYAQTQAQELQCPALEVSQLVEITDVTAQFNTATKGLTGKQYADTLRAEMAKLEKACATSDDIRCNVVTLYQGGRYNLYKYNRFQDVRLVFAPEHASAAFGGDPDNFEFPRYDLDVTFVRVYGKDGKPAKIDNYFKWSAQGAKEGELTFIPGHPGRTSRGLTVAQLEYLRDVSLPKTLFRQSEFRGMTTEFQNRGPEQKRISSNQLLMVENSLKANKGKLEQLSDKNFFAQKVAAEQELRQKVNADPKLKAKYGAAWDEIARAQNAYRDIREEFEAMEGSGISGQLFAFARTLVRAAEELPKPDSERLRGFNDASLTALKTQLASKAPLYPELEIANLTFSLTKMREELGPDHPFVKKVLGKESPRALATRLVKGSKLADPKVREALFTGGKKAIDASTDAMIRLAALVDPDARAIRKKYEEEVEAVIRKNSELVAQARFDLYGTDLYPDATGTLRLSYGSVKGYMEDGKKVEPFTTMGATFDRHTGEDPFALPKSWLAAQKDLTASTPMNFVTTNDIIGGNSGSPIISKDAEIVGLVFDGNRQSLGGEYGYDETANRAIGVHSEALVESLKKIYKADRILEELRPGSTPTVKSAPGR
ncbi:S46 family peptidase [Archangium violaceum]|uniref:S46 family peptidase n=1 Tax=Archangium violaceum TaxID=83451 RepID=UPI0019522694|nr:S46 family peptidase [Archangium violaceum]QRN92852.1 S46 family peptidase [Archangium violaceum]